MASSPAAALELVPGAVLAGRYRIVSRLGAGGMGEVYRADDLRLGQPVALKFLKPGRRSPEREQQLLDEVRLGREISHPNVCRIHDVGEFEGHLSISMEYIDGEDLGSLLRRIGRLPPDKALAVAREICAGLAAAHERGIVHRDLKPANVMIDGRGRARITDFGVAAFESGQEQGIVSGTLPYMAPEQLEGAPASVASDLFALGLTLFEIWTGRRMFSGGSISEIVQQHRSDSAKIALRSAKEIEPAVAAVIAICLDAHPAQRPPSVRALLAALPGRDALDVAISAGETPSPAMVAAATEPGDLSRGMAWLALVLVVASVLGSAAISPRSTLEGRVGLPLSTDALEARARKLISDIGWNSEKTRRRDSASSFYLNGDFVRARDRGTAAASGASTAQALRFLYRQSPRELIPHQADNSYRVTSSDPSFDIPGMISIVLAIDGSLRFFAIVPPSLPPPAAEVSWNVLLAAAGLAPSSLQIAAPVYVCPVDNDQRIAWTGTDALDRTPIRVEAAALRGQPVWFAVISPWEEAMKVLPKAAGLEVSDAVTMLFLIMVPIAIALLARRNLHRGQGDRVGATRLAIAAFVIMTVASVLRMHHVMNVYAEGENLARQLAMALLIAVCVWFAYVGVEPFARRRWPRMLISWSRVLEGRLGDPMIGRDLLIGLACGALLTVATHALVALSGPTPGSLPIQVSATSFTSPRQAVFFLVYNVADAIVRAAGVIALLVILRGLLRSQTAAVTITIVMMAASNLDTPIGSMAFRIAMITVAAAAVTYLAFRFGLIAVCSASWMYLVALRVPLTLDPGSWYFGRSVLAMSVVAALALFSFVIALGGKSILPGPVFEE